MSSLAKIIVVDDDVEMRNLLQRYFSENNFQVRTVPDGQSLDKAMAREPADLLVLDLMMPHEDGLSICRRLRAANENVPIIMLTAKGDPIDKIIGLEMGADDYLAKPFTPRELLARINAILRRKPNIIANNLDDEKISFGDFILDCGQRVLINNGENIELSSREFALLKTLINHKGRPLSRSQIIDFALGRDAEVTDRAIDVQILRLRRLIESDISNPYWIKTVWGHGYVFAAS